MSRPPHHSPHRAAFAPAAIALTLLTATALAGCADADPSGSPAPTASDGVIGDGHGAIAGAQEVAEPPLHLLTVGDDGTVQQLDLLDESVDELGSLDGVTSTATDGRFLFAASSSAGTVDVVDSGYWTWSHIDHFHYYRGTPREVGTLESDGGGEATFSPGTATTGVFFTGSGEAVLFETAGLADGDMTERLRVETTPHTGLIAGVGTGALVTRADAEGESANHVDLLNADGETIESIDCTAASGSIETVVGTVVGCADGAVLAIPTDDGVADLTRIDHPDGTTAPAATSFANREGRPSVAGLAGPTSFWMLDTREQSWKLIDAERPLQQVTAVDDADGHVLALTDDGRVLVLSGESGELLSETAPLLDETTADPSLLAGATLVADQQRAYLNGPAENLLYEIDFADDARVSRTFETDRAPLFLAETGR
ncbi:ABC transporter [Marisediminicola sp. LYQ134]|uniref:ABC transporter n=1 Tax=Marisediminicola sp. LYQ134 TaxID=3391061 RepID=UPI003983B544